MVDDIEFMEQPFFGSIRDGCADGKSGLKIHIKHVNTGDMIKNAVLFAPDQDFINVLRVDPDMTKIINGRPEPFSLILEKENFNRLEIIAKGEKGVPVFSELTGISPSASASIALTIIAFQGLRMPVDRWFAPRFFRSHRLPELQDHLGVALDLLSLHGRPDYRAGLLHGP